MPIMLQTPRLPLAFSHLVHLPLLVLLALCSLPAIAQLSNDIAVEAPSFWTSCTPGLFTWDWGGSTDMYMTLYITNYGINQPSSYKGGSVTTIISTTIHLTDSQYTWPKVAVPPGGQYALGFFTTADSSEINVATSSFLVQGSDTSCLAAASSSASSARSTQPSSTARPTSTALPASSSFSFSSAVPAVPAISSTNSASSFSGSGRSTNAGAIAGGVIAGLVAVVILGLLGWWYRQKRAQKQAAAKRDEMYLGWKGNGASHVSPRASKHSHNSLVDAGGADVADAAGAGVVGFPFGHYPEPAARVDRGGHDDKGVIARMGADVGHEKGEGSDDMHASSMVLPYLNNAMFPGPEPSHSPVSSSPPDASFMAPGEPPMAYSLPQPASAHSPQQPFCSPPQIPHSLQPSSSPLQLPRRSPSQSAHSSPPQPTYSPSEPSYPPMPPAAFAPSVPSSTSGHDHTTTAIGGGVGPQNYLGHGRKQSQSSLLQGDTAAAATAAVASFGGTDVSMAGAGGLSPSAPSLPPLAYGASASPPSVERTASIERKGSIKNRPKRVPVPVLNEEEVRAAKAEEECRRIKEEQERSTVSSEEAAARIGVSVNGGHGFAYRQATHVLEVDIPSAAML